MNHADQEQIIRRAINICRAECSLAEHTLAQIKVATDDESAQRLIVLALGDLRRAEAALHVVIKDRTTS